MADADLIDALRIVGEGRDLDADRVQRCLAGVMAGEVAEPLLAAFLTALRVKGETPEELIGAVRAVRERMTPFPTRHADVIDTCGTGGDGANTVNVSTASAIVVAACGVPVVKHGNRSASGNSGSAEVLTELGVTVEAPDATLARCFDRLGVTFLFAPRFHPALKSAASVRRLLPFRTLFNLIGPLANPAGPRYQLVGVPTPRAARLVAGAFATLGTGRVAVVTGSDGLDEVTLNGPTAVLLVAEGQIQPDEWTPADFGLPTVRAEQLRVTGPADSAARLRAVFAGGDDPARDVILANAAAALFVAGAATTVGEGVERARGALRSGAAAELLTRWTELSRTAD